MDLLYAAPGDALAWARFLNEFAEQFQNDTTSIASFDNKNQRYNLNSNHGVPPQAAKLYMEHYGAMDEWYLRAKGRLKAGYVGDGQALCSNRELLRTEFYNDFIGKFDWLHEAAAVLEANSNTMSVLTMMRSPARKPFSATELRVVKEFVPHLQRALVLHRRMVDLKSFTDIQHWALDQVPFGVVILQSNGQVLFANRAATELCTGGELSLSCSGLRAAHPYREQLEGLIKTALKLDIGRAPGDALAILRDTGQPLMLTVMPIRHPHMPACAAVIFIGDPDRHSLPLPEMLRAFFGFTPAEARLAVLLMAGESLKAAADTLGVTMNTVRTQLKCLFMKTGVYRQSDLLRILLNLPPATHVDISSFPS